MKGEQRDRELMKVQDQGLLSNKESVVTGGRLSVAVELHHCCRDGGKGYMYTRSGLLKAGRKLCLS